MSVKNLIVLSLSAILVAAAFAGAENTAELTVEQIVQQANKMAYYQGLDGKAKVQMTITDKQGRTRNREFVILRKNAPDSDNQKYFVYFQAPADVRRMVFMVHKYAAADKDDDRWLYLPNLDLVRRIAAGDKRTSFAGSDFLYEDVSGRSLLEDTHTLHQTTDQYYIIKNAPKKPETVEFAEFLVYVDKATMMPMKMEYFGKDGAVYRTIEVLEIKNIKSQENDKQVEYPTVLKSIVKDLRTGSSTEMVFSDVQYNLGISDEIFSERYLKRPPKEALR